MLKIIKWSGVTWRFKHGVIISVSGSAAQEGLRRRCGCRRFFFFFFKRGNCSQAGHPHGKTTGGMLLQRSLRFLLSSSSVLQYLGVCWRCHCIPLQDRGGVHADFSVTTGVVAQSMDMWILTDFSVTLHLIDSCIKFTPLFQLIWKDGAIIEQLMM